MTHIFSQAFLYIQYNVSFLSKIKNNAHKVVLNYSMDANKLPKPFKSDEAFLFLVCTRYVIFTDLKLGYPSVRYPIEFFKNCNVNILKKMKN
jgi:hypothetical protein